MRSTFLAFCLMVVVVAATSPAWAQTTSYIEYIGVAGTGNYNTATNWNHLVLDPSTGKYVLADPPQNSVPGNSPPAGNEEIAYIRNGATVTVANSVPQVSTIQVGVAGDVTKDAGGTIQPRPGSTLVVRSGGVLNLCGSAGLGYPSLQNGTFGASYDGTLTVDGGQFTAYSALYIGTNGARNPPGTSSAIVPYQGTGYLNVKSGYFSMMAAGSILYIGTGRYADTTGKRVEGIATYSGGNVSMVSTSATYVGNAGARGSLTVREDDPINAATTIDSSEAGLTVGGFGFFGNVGGSVGFHERSSGTYVQEAGEATWGGLMVGRSHADGLVELNGGTFILNADGVASVGIGGGRTVGATGYLATGVGSLVVNDGYFQANNARTKFIVGAGYNEDGNENNIGKGIGVFTINGGLVEMLRAGTDVDNTLEVGNNRITGSGGTSGSYGEFNVLGGTFFSNKRILFAKNDGTTGIFHPGKDGNVTLGWLAFWEGTTEDPNEPVGGAYRDSIPKMIVDVTPTGHSQITVYQDLWLRGTLDVQTYGWRPKEGDSWKIIVLDEYLSEIYHDFEVFDSNITNGLPTDPMDPNVELSAFYGTGIAGDPNHGEPNVGYYVTFRGYTAGDANKDHSVDGGDLALMGGSWLQSGKVWGDGDFNGDGSVDGGDLALMGGNWMWSLPAAPETPLPEPATLALLAMGGMVLIRRRRT